MKTIAVLSVFLMTQLSDNYQTLAVLFKVHRTVQNGADSFEIPSSLCPHNNEYDCNAFNAEAITQSCNCSCLLKEATFKPFETQWSCYENNDVRMNLQSQQHSKPGEKGCTQAMRTMFIDESLNSSLRVLNIGDEKEISLPNNWDRCTLNRAYTWYSECDDSRLSLAQKLDVIDNLFKLESGRQNYILQVEKNVYDSHLLRGHIINLGIQCANTSATQNRNGCLLFKMEGSIICDVTNTSKPPLRKVPSTSPDMISSKPKTTTIPKTDGHQETATLQPSTTLEISSSPTRQDVALQSTTSRSHPDDTGRSTGHNSQQNAVWIIISVSVSSMVLVIIMAFVVCRRSLSSKNIGHMGTVEGRESQVPEVIHSHTNAEFPEEEPNGYFSLTFREPSIYTSTYQVPVDRRTSFNEISNPLGQTFEDEQMHDPFPFPQRHNFKSFNQIHQIPAFVKKQAELWDRTLKQTFEDEHMHDSFPVSQRPNFQSFKQNPQITASAKKQTKTWARTLGQNLEEEQVHDRLNVPQRQKFQSFKHNPQIPESVKKHAKNETIRFLQEYGPLSIEQLVYNIVEEILIGGQETTDVDEDQNENDPVYQVIEEFCGEPPQDTTQHDDAISATRDPVYSILEETVSNKESQKNPEISDC